jgi:hypothetical protein
MKVLEPFACFHTTYKHVVYSFRKHLTSFLEDWHSLRVLLHS